MGMSGGYLSIKCAASNHMYRFAKIFRSHVYIYVAAYVNVYI